MRPWMRILSLQVAVLHLPVCAATLSDVSGTWHNTAANAHDVSIEVLDDTRAMASWYVHGPGGQPVHLYLDGRIDGTTISGIAYRASGMSGQTDPAALDLDIWGKVALDVFSCQSLRMRYHADGPAGSGYGDGEFELRRLKRPRDLRCNPMPRPTAACALSLAQHPRAGIGLQLFYADQAESWEWADDLGVEWLRIEIRWDWIEPYPGQYDTSYADRVMALAHAHRQRIMVLFNHVPQWAAEQSDLLPRRASAAMAWFVRRYGARISAFEIFNEPNLPGYGWPALGGSTEESATIYAHTLSAAARAIRKVDKQAFIVSAGLSPQGDPESYFRVIARTTPSDCYDSVGLHPYGSQGQFANVRRNLAMLLAQEQLLPKPIWFTEYGTADDPQRAALLNALVTDKESGAITFFFTERDLGTFTETYGLRRKDGAAKSDYYLFRQLFAP